MDNYHEDFKLISDKQLLNALMVVDYYPRVYPGVVRLEEGLEEAYVKVYNSLLEELIERGILEC